MKTFIVLALIAISLTIFTTCGVVGLKFDRSCTGYLERAANANTIEIAQTELSTALKYIESHNLTEGYTSVWWTTPDEDLGFWYNNIKTSNKELKDLAPDASSLEKSNMLIKLRETLLDNDGGVTVPWGTSRYPHNAAWAVYFTLATLIIVGLIIWLFIWMESNQ